MGHFIRKSLFQFLVVNCLLLVGNCVFAQGLSITGTVSANDLSIIGTIQCGTLTGTLANGIVKLTNLSASGTATTTTYLRGDNTWATIAGGGSVRSVSVLTANGVSGSVTNPTTTPAITLALGAISPSSVTASGAISGTTLLGTILTVAQPNIISVGTLSGLSVTGNVFINTNATNPTNINTGTSTGSVNIGGSGALTINIGNGNAANTLSIGGASSSTTIGSIKNTIGIAGVANGNGVRIGNGRFTINKTVPTYTASTTNITATVSNILNEGIIGFNSPAVNLTLTLPSAQGATGLVQALPGTPKVGDMFTFMYYNLGADDITLVGSTGVTIVGPPTSLPGVAISGLTRVVYCMVTNITPNAELISVY